MERKALQPEGLRKPAVPLSTVIVSGDLVYVSGQGGHGADGNLVQGSFEDEARQTFENVRACLAAAGCGFGDVLRVGGYLVALEDFPTYNEIYREFFSEPYPARTTIQCGLAGGMRIEIDAVARAPGG
jgi:2-iminobutanoate/2-iminopropanoate deaminase